MLLSCSEGSKSRAKNKSKIKSPQRTAPTMENISVAEKRSVLDGGRLVLSSSQLSGALCNEAGKSFLGFICHLFVFLEVCKVWSDGTFYSCAFSHMGFIIHQIKIFLDGCKISIV